ncbi:hypothetical protein NEOLEDRAFT_1143982 [Neolentinus lepideus HHB14362 ss-1]|uniref:Uncharacterized protein n=1 Tax=Neolentinus lepideus HHB14362 ss-1 TaxID=1314782 RepID=A0A165M630_9AGAM|nr:hypothetical protein NEOLEDRAFT_1143982 [Neolentinus lepideus HHB14362 ss-1]
MRCQLNIEVLITQSLWLTPQVLWLVPLMSTESHMDCCTPGSQSQPRWEPDVQQFPPRR